MNFNQISEKIEIKVNGDLINCSDQIILIDLLNQMALNPRLIAVEYNGEILHRQYWNQTKINNGDRLEIVTIVGGG